MIKRIINWVAERSDVVRRLRAELDAAVDYHSHYSGKVDKALGQPREKGDLLSNHVRAIEKLRSERY